MSNTFFSLFCFLQAREKDATEYQQQVGNKIAETLRKLIAPYFLRRTKAEVFNTDKKSSTGHVNKSGDSVDAASAYKNTKYYIYEIYSLCLNLF